MPPSSRHQLLLVAVNRAAAFNVAARWVLHDLRSPAQSLTLMADLIAEPGGDLEDILREACANLARSLELLARVVHPPGAGGVGPISVAEPIAFIADLQRAGRTHARVELDVDPALPPAAGVVSHLEHALLNLVLNGLRLLAHLFLAVPIVRDPTNPAGESKYNWPPLARVASGRT